MVKKTDSGANYNQFLRKYGVSLTALLLVALFGGYVYLVQYDRDAEAADLASGSDLIAKTGKEYCEVDMAVSGSFNLSQITANSLSLTTAPGKEATISLSNKYTSGISNTKSRFTMSFAGEVMDGHTEKKDEFKISADQDTYKVSGCYSPVVEIAGTGKLIRTKSSAGFLFFKKTKTESQEVNFSYKFANNTKDNTFAIVGMKITSKDAGSVILDAGTVTLNQYVLKPRGYFTVATTKLLPSGKVAIQGSDVSVTPTPGH